MTAARPAVQQMPLDSEPLATVERGYLPEPEAPWLADIIAKVTIPGVPMSKQRPRFVRKTGAVFTPKETRDREHAIGQYVWAHGWRKPPDPEMAFGVRAVFYVVDQQRKDVDNMLKLVLDGCNRIIWADDCQVFEVMAWKVEVTENPRTELIVYRLGYPAKRMTNCEHCGKRFRTYPSWTEQQRRFCKKRCANLHAMTGEMVTCSGCGKEIYRPINRIANAKYGLHYCSSKCKQGERNVQLSCAHCGKDFQRARSLLRGPTIERCCSQACSDARRNTRRRSVRKGDCEVCSGPVSRREYKRCIGCRTAPPLDVRAEVVKGVKETRIVLEAL